MKIREKPAEKVWQDFQQEAGLTEHQLALFRRYEELLSLRNKEFNLTAIKELSGVVRQHFIDSLALTKAFDLKTVTTICDIGPGAGFPSLPLKILYPHLKIILMEVTQKKRQFLQEVITMLGLEQVELYEHDWRTFIRTTAYHVDLFVTRAAIADLELIKAFRPACFYRTATIIYWAAEQWQPHKKVAPFVKRDFAYRLGHKNRRLIFLGLPD